MACMAGEGQRREGGTVRLGESGGRLPQTAHRRSNAGLQFSGSAPCGLEPRAQGAFLPHAKLSTTGCYTIDQWCACFPDFRDTIVPDWPNAWCRAAPPGAARRELMLSAPDHNGSAR